MPRTPTASAPSASRAAVSSALMTPPMTARNDLQRRLVGHAPAGLEPADDPEPLEPVGETLATTVDDDDGAPLTLRDDLGEDVSCSAIVVPPSLTTTGRRPSRRRPCRRLRSHGRAHVE